MGNHVGFMSLVFVWVFLMTLQMGTTRSEDIQQNEVTALIDFKNRLKDPNNVLVSWDKKLVSACSWYHITCDDSNPNRVIRVDLGNVGISGTISPNLGNLEKLKYLELYGNRLNGNMPPELGKLANLLSLDLYDNTLRGELPKTFGNLKSLKFLRLYNNKFDGCARVSTLKKLREYNPSMEIIIFDGNPNLHFCAID